MNNEELRAVSIYEELAPPVIVRTVEGPLDSNKNPSSQMIFVKKEFDKKVKDLYDFCYDSALSSREKSISLTTLEEFAMWYTKAIFHYKLNETD